MAIAHANAQPCSATSVDTLAHVASVIDGDTVRLEQGLKVRLIGIDTPELSHDGRPAAPFARAAKRELATVLGHHAAVKLQYGPEAEDRYGRQLAHLLYRRRNQSLIVVAGSRTCRRDCYSPNTRLLDCYRRRQGHARAAGAGLWSLPAYQSVSAKALPPDSLGYRFVSGTVVRIAPRPGALWLDLAGGLRLRITPADRAYFRELALEHLLASEIAVRGWIYERSGEQRMRIRHPEDLKVLSR